MKNNNNELPERRILPFIMLICATSFVFLSSMKNFQTVVFEYNNEVIKLETMHYVEQDELLKLANITLIDAEITDVSLTSNQNIKTIVIEDTFTVNIAVDGQNIEVVTLADSVSNILQKAEISLGNDDIIDKSLSQTLNSDTSIEIIRVTTSQYIVESDIPFDTVKKENSKLDLGVTNTVTSGVLGVLATTSEQILHNGVVVDEYVIGDEILQVAVNEVVEYGTFNVNRGVTARDGVLETPNGTFLQYSKVIEVTATAYSTENSSWTKTASGTTARVGAIAVDPRVIPLGTKLYITSADGKSWIYGTAVAEDTGGSIIGNKIDLFFNTNKECINFGVKSAIVYVLS